jgi:hypothetical protein
MSEQDTTSAETTAPAAPELSIQDLVNLRAVVDLAVRRGAFGASEVSSVGMVFDRVNAFLTAVLPAQPEQTPPTE